MKPILQWISQKNRDYGLRLTSDLSDTQMVTQPAAGMNHPVWILGHLCLYHKPALAMLRNEPVPDVTNDPEAPIFDEGSAPVADISAYPPGADMVRRYREGHEAIAGALASWDERRATETVPLERWVAFFGTTGTALSYLLGTHEGVHLGQLSAWRRATGLQRVL